MITKSKAYIDTTVSPSKTRGETEGMLEKYNIKMKNYLIETRI